MSILKLILPPILYHFWKRVLFAFTKDHTQLKSLKNEFHVLNQHAAPNEIVLRPNLSLLAHPDSLYSFQYFCHMNRRAKQELDAFVEIAKTKQTFLDIGALHGIFSLVFAKQSSDNKVIAVDPSPIAFSKLLYNIHINRLENISPIESAVSDASKPLEMHYEWEHLVSGDSSDASIQITTRIGDEICKSNALEPDLIKIDVEGHEVRVLKGLINTLKDHKPVVFLEFHPAMIRKGGDTPAILTDLFTQLGYQAHKVNGEVFSLIDFAAISSDENLILRPSVR